MGQVVSRQYLVRAVLVHHNIIHWVVQAESVTIAHTPHLERLLLITKVVFLFPIVLAVAVAVLAVPHSRCQEERLEIGQSVQMVALVMADQVFCQVFQERHSPTVPVLSGRPRVLSEQIMAVAGTAVLWLLHT